MKKHLLVIFLVAVLLGGVYLVGQSSTSKKTATSDKSNSKQQPTNSFNKKLYSLSDPNSLWLVVNKKRPLRPMDYAPTDLIDVGNGQTLRKAAGQNLANLLEAAKAAGYTLTVDSGYRSYAIQQDVYRNEVKGFGQAYADSESARPGYSEHQTGWAVDVGTAGCHLDDCFGNTPAGKWLEANAYRYGFLRRYPADKASVTGFRNEAWHFRYVGTELATEMHKRGTKTLEEFFGLPAAPNY
ncbi:MAG TPA: D-alanyl-D-alanine carboxypeptidase family protein [Candidatus Saccharimonadales bacterium]|nr:D-alanyl-D-alanine carboxypeptidase family protein [Candidatus Saccharimonadales bacterium]